MVFFSLRVILAETVTILIPDFFCCASFSHWRFCVVILILYFDIQYQYCLLNSLGIGWLG